MYVWQITNKYFERIAKIEVGKNIYCFLHLGLDKYSSVTHLVSSSSGGGGGEPPTDIVTCCVSPNCDLDTVHVVKHRAVPMSCEIVGSPKI